MSTEKEKEEKPILVERRKVKCGCGTDCEVPERQDQLILEFRELRSDLSEMREDIQGVINIFNEGEAVVRFFKGAGRFVRWLTLTGASIGLLYAWFTGWLHDVFSK